MDINVTSIAFALRVAALLLFAAGFIYTGVEYFRRPAARLAVRRGVMFLLKSRGGIFSVVKTFFLNIFLQTYVYRRDVARWIAHFTMFIGGAGLLLFHALPRVVLGITEKELFPGWSLELRAFTHDLFFALLLIGAVIALFRRVYLRDMPESTNKYNIIPLIFIIIIGVTGLFAFEFETAIAITLGVDYAATRGIYYFTHSVVVYACLASFAFTKFFHWPIRLMAFFTDLYLIGARESGLRACNNCGFLFAPEMQLGDILNLAGDSDEELLSLCSKCRQAARVRQLMELGTHTDPKVKSI